MGNVLLKTNYETNFLSADSFVTKRSADSSGQENSDTETMRDDDKIQEGGSKIENHFSKYEPALRRKIDDAVPSVDRYNRLTPELNSEFPEPKSALFMESASSPPSLGTSIKEVDLQRGGETSVELRERRKHSLCEVEREAKSLSDIMTEFQTKIPDRVPGEPLTIIRPRKDNTPPVYEGTIFMKKPNFDSKDSALLCNDDKPFVSDSRFRFISEKVAALRNGLTPILTESQDETNAEASDLNAFENGIMPDGDPKCSTNNRNHAIDSNEGEISGEEDKTPTAIRCSSPKPKHGIDNKVASKIYLAHSPRIRPPKPRAVPAVWKELEATDFDEAGKPQEESSPSSSDEFGKHCLQITTRDTTRQAEEPKKMTATEVNQEGNEGLSLGTPMIKTDPENLGEIYALKQTQAEISDKEGEVVSSQKIPTAEMQPTFGGMHNLDKTKQVVLDGIGSYVSPMLKPSREGINYQCTDKEDATSFVPGDKKTKQVSSDAYSDQSNVDENTPDSLIVPKLLDCVDKRPTSKKVPPKRKGFFRLKKVRKKWPFRIKSRPGKAADNQERDPKQPCTPKQKNRKRCPRCFEVVSNKDISSHYEKHSQLTNQDFYLCLWCKFSSVEQRSIVEHYANKHYRCPICKKLSGPSKHKIAHITYCNSRSTFHCLHNAFS